MPVSVYQKSPGVLLEEQAPQDVLPATVSTGQGAMLAVTEKGPLDEFSVTTFSEWVSTYGQLLSDKDTNGNYKYPGYLQAKNFFANGGTTLHTRRVVHYTDETDPDTFTCVKSTVTLRDGDSGTAAVIGSSAACAGNGGDEGAGASAGTFTGTLDVAYTVTVTTAGAYGGTGEVTITAVGGEDHGISSTFQPVDTVAFAVGTKGVTLALTDGGDATLTLGDCWTIACTAQGAQCLRIDATYYGDYDNKGSAQAADSPTTGLSIAVDTGSLASTYQLSQYEEGASTRTFDQLHHDADSVGYAEYEINGTTGSTVIAIAVLSSNIPVVTYTGEIPLVGGVSGLASLDKDDYIGDAGAETGIHGFNNITDILAAGCPDAEAKWASAADGEAIIKAMIDWADTQHPYSFVVSSLVYGTGQTAALAYHGTTIAKDSSRYALYYPWIKSDSVWVSPTMAIIGQFMRNDSLSGRGVWTSPAGLDMSLNNVQDVERVIGDTKGGELNEVQINVLRNKPGAGLCIWGSRTGTTSEKKYFKFIGPRRNTSYVAATLDASTQFSTHHETGPTLWRKVNSVSNTFLTSHYNAGGFRGDSKQQAFFVKCNSDNNTTDLEEQGVTVLEVGIWNKRTSEFLIIKLSQKSGE